MIEIKLSQQINESLPGITEGVVVQAYQSGQKKIDIQCGKTYRYYDLASLTKVIFTVSRIMQLHEQEKIDVATSVQKYISWYPHREVTLQELLTHSSGHQAWNGYYKSIVKDETRYKKNFSEIKLNFLNVCE